MGDREKKIQRSVWDGAWQCYVSKLIIRRVKLQWSKMKGRKQQKRKEKVKCHWFFWKSCSTYGHKWCLIDLIFSWMLENYARFNSTRWMVTGGLNHTFVLEFYNLHFLLMFHTMEECDISPLDFISMSKCILRIWRLICFFFYQGVMRALISICNGTIFTFILVTTFWKSS